MSRRPLASAGTRIAAAAFAGLVVAAVLAAPDSAAVHAADVSPLPPMSLMIQVSTTAQQTRSDSGVLARLRDTLATIGVRHRGAAAQERIYDLVLTDINDPAQPTTLASAVLDVIAPYLPGGSTPAFDNVFVGTVAPPTCTEPLGVNSVIAACASEPAWDVYSDGIVDSTLTAWQVSASETLARAFVARYPWVRLNWYLSYEAFLPTLMRDIPSNPSATTVRAAYVAQLGRLAGTLGKIAPNRTFLWSPALDQPMAQLRVDNQLAAFDTNFRVFIASVRDTIRSQAGNSGSRMWLDVQDGLARSCLLIGGSYNNTVATRIEWMRYLALFRTEWLAAVQINAELFASPYCPADQPVSVIRARLAAYKSAGIPIGPSFDLTGWARMAG